MYNQNKPENELYAQDVPDEYRPLIENADFVRLESSYASIILSYLFRDSGKIKTVYSNRFGGADKNIIPEGLELSRQGQIIADKISGCTIVDLASSSESGFKRFAETLPVGRYIGVDLNTPNTFDRREDGAEFLQIQNDILAFTSRIRSDAYDLFYLSGFDGSPSRQELMDEGQRTAYLQALVKEIRRALKPFGIFVFGQNHRWDNHLLWKFVQEEGMEEGTLFQDSRYILKELEADRQALALNGRVAIGSDNYLLSKDPCFRPIHIRPAYLFQKLPIESESIQKKLS